MVSQEMRFYKLASLIASAIPFARVCENGKPAAVDYIGTALRNLKAAPRT